MFPVNISVLTSLDRVLFFTLSTRVKQLELEEHFKFVQEDMSFIIFYIVLSGWPS